jgi:hypothetical protein
MRLKYRKDPRTWYLPDPLTYESTETASRTVRRVPSWDGAHDDSFLLVADAYHYCNALRPCAHPPINRNIARRPHARRLVSPAQLLRMLRPIVPNHPTGPLFGKTSGKGRRRIGRERCF